MANIKHTLRSMAWCRAQGELRSILATFNSGEETTDYAREHERTGYQEMRKLVEAFITEVNDRGLAE